MSATTTPATMPPINIETTERPDITKAITIPGTIACAIASPARERRLNTKNAPTGAMDKLSTAVAINARTINSYSRNAKSGASVMTCPLHATKMLVLEINNDVSKAYQLLTHLQDNQTQKRHFQSIKLYHITL